MRCGLKLDCADTMTHGDGNVDPVLCQIGVIRCWPVS
jgi:hypothetical protein